MKNPYQNLPSNSFWKTSVEENSFLNTKDYFKPKWHLSEEDKIATAGSCFAQHIGRSLREIGLPVIDTEPAPVGLLSRYWPEFGYGMYSARYGNIYTARQLLQLAKEATGASEQRTAAWERGGGFFDAFRPGVEPSGFGSIEQLTENRTYHLQKVRDLLLELDVFVFTLGLTEAWECTNSGDIYPLAPGTVAGSFEQSNTQFVNFGFNEVYNDLVEFFNHIRNFRNGRDFRVLLTVSPVPLTATASGDHVLSATTYSKSVLRAVAGQLRRDLEFVDYFPSYEIITSPNSRSTFYKSNLRSVSPEAVEVVMETFKRAFNLSKNLPEASNENSSGPRNGEKGEPEKSIDEIKCEEELLGAFSK